MIFSFAISFLATGCGIQTGGCIAGQDANPGGTVVASGSFPLNTKNVTGTVLIENVGGVYQIYISSLAGVSESGLRIDVQNNMETLRYSLKACTGNQLYGTTIANGTRTWSTLTLVNPTLAPPNNTYATVTLN